jgi:hypothetical protein
MKPGRAFAITAKGEIYLHFHDVEHAMTCLSEGLTLELERGNARKVARCRHLIGLVCEERGVRLKQQEETTYACEQFQKALQEMREAQKLYEQEEIDVFNYKEDLARITARCEECQAAGEQSDTRLP